MMEQICKVTSIVVASELAAGVTFCRATIKVQRLSLPPTLFNSRARLGSGVVFGIRLFDTCLRDAAVGTL